MRETPAVRAAAVSRVRADAEARGMRVLGEAESVLVGPSGNHEIFLHLALPGGPT